MQSRQNLTLSFDIGHSSIGWAVLSSPARTRETPFPEPTIEGCGSVLFPKDDCLASARRGHRRTRRNIRSTRHRIKQMAKLLAHLGVLTEEELTQKTMNKAEAAPFVLAARALQTDKASLNWIQIWQVLRWYAHNRGYDGNARWSNQAQDEGDSDREKAAAKLMEDHQTNTMAETICKELGIDLQDAKKRTSSWRAYKNLNLAFPRKVVRAEVLQILQTHLGQLPQLSQELINTLVAPDSVDEQTAWQTIPVPDLHLPKRYFGGLLFGQLVPRFDNRIISQCSITWEHIYREQKSQGASEELARKQADKRSKVPKKSCPEFLNFRWAMLLANMKVGTGETARPLTAEERKQVHHEMEQAGRLTPTELHKIIQEVTGFDKSQSNIKQSFEVHPDSKEALELDLIKAYYLKAEDEADSITQAEQKSSKKKKKSQGSIGHFWRHLPEVSKQRAQTRWRKQRIVNLQWMLDQCRKENMNLANLEQEIDHAFEAQSSNQKSQPTKELYLERTFFAPKTLSGRAPHSRQVMQETLEFVLTTNRHPTEAAKGTLPAGPLYRSEAIKEAEASRPIDDLTNNHLIRHRLLILERLTESILKEYASNHSVNISHVVVEVARDLQEYSGLSAKEMEGELTKRLKHFKSAVTYLLNHGYTEEQLTGSLIRKCRIALDLDWKCPFTGKKYDAQELPDLDREHIIPYADRPSNSLDSLVLTFPWVNSLKGKRTAKQFIQDVTGDERFHTPKQYEKFVEALKVAKKKVFPDDHRRQSNRKKLLLVDQYDKRGADFTQGALTQTSHLNRLAARQLEKQLSDKKPQTKEAKVTSIPGQVTAEVRKSWRLLPTLSTACPEILHPSIKELEEQATQEAEKVIKKLEKDAPLSSQEKDTVIQEHISKISATARKQAGKTKNKTEIRELTHLHHALDAAVLALTQHYLPGHLPGEQENEKGRLWKAMLTRNKTPEQLEYLKANSQFKIHHKRDHKKEIERTKDGQPKLDASLVDLPEQLKEQLSQRLAEARVVQHVPADRSGSHLELNPWRLVTIEKDEAILIQRPNRSSLELEDSNQRKWKDSSLSAKETKLLKRCRAKLTPRQINLINRGILKITTEKTNKLVGLKPGKLQKNQSVLVIGDNFGVALDPEPTIIRFHQVQQQLDKLTKANGGKFPRILRNGMLIQIEKNPPRSSQDYRGIWQITSVKDNDAGIALDMVRPGYPKAKNKVAWASINRSLQPLIEAGLTILSPPLTGLAASTPLED